MRKSLAVFAAIGLAATMSVALAGPVSAKGGGPKPPPKESKCSSSASKKGIAYAMNGFLGAPDSAGKTAYVQNGSVLTSIVDQTYAAANQAHLIPAGQATIAVTLTYQCTGKTTAKFQYGLGYKDNTTGTTGAVLANATGGAVLVKGHWLITQETVCNITNLLGMAVPGATFGAQCYQASGLPVPSS